MVKDLKTIDSPIWRLIKAEEKRQQETINLIPSENYVSAAVLEAIGSVLTNKYSEGYPGKRYYGGQENVDQIEKIAQERALKLFGLSEGKYHVNVQPYSGSPANLAVYLALANPGDTLMGMSLTHGGHLSHGHPVSISGRLFNFTQYSVREADRRLDYDEIWKLAKASQPKIIVSGATAYPRIIDFQKFQAIAQDVGASHLADISHIAGLIVAGRHPSPFPFTDVVTTTTHKTLRGPRAAMIFCRSQLAEAMDRSVFPGLQGGPHDHIIAAVAVGLKEALAPGFKRYGRQVVKNAAVLAHELEVRGYKLVTGGTDNHLLLIDLTNKGLTGQEAQLKLDKAGLTVNKNTVPFEKRTAFDPSGIRLGTPAVTTRGMKEKQMKLIAGYIDQVLLDQSMKKLAKIRSRIRRLARQFPAPGS